MTEKLSLFDRPNSYIGRSVPRPDARRLLAGRGRFVDDRELQRMVHAAFLRSPHPHAQIGAIRTQMEVISGNLNAMNQSVHNVSVSNAMMRRDMSVLTHQVARPMSMFNSFLP